VPDPDLEIREGAGGDLQKNFFGPSGFSWVKRGGGGGVPGPLGSSPGSATEYSCIGKTMQHLICTERGQILWCSDACALNAVRASLNFLAYRDTNLWRSKILRLSLLLYPT